MQLEFLIFFLSLLQRGKNVQDATWNSILGAQHIIKQHAIKRKIDKTEIFFVSHVLTYLLITLPRLFWDNAIVYKSY